NHLQPTADAQPLDCRCCYLLQVSSTTLPTWPLTTGAVPSVQDTANVSGLMRETLYRLLTRSPATATPTNARNTTIVFFMVTTSSSSPHQVRLLIAVG